MSKITSDKVSLSDTIVLLLSLTVFISSLLCVFINKTTISVSTLSASFSEDEEFDVFVLNAATKEDFMLVSGIGETKAEAIISYRESLGGFSDVYELLDLNAVTPRIFEEILKHFYFKTPSEELDKIPDVTLSVALDSLDETKPDTDLDVSESAVNETTDTKPCMKCVNVNVADAEEIKESLLISKEAAEQIVSIREMIGGYKSRAELSLCSLLTEDVLNKINEYVLL